MWRGQIVPHHFEEFSLQQCDWKFAFFLFVDVVSSREFGVWFVETSHEYANNEA